MENENPNANVEGRQVQQNGAVQVQTVSTVPPTTPTEPKEGLKSKLKKHWKGVVGGIVGLGTVVASGVVAYKKGKAAGAACVPMVQQDEDYSLNPNE